MRQVSFTLLISKRCDSNRTQYERNSLFRQLVNVVSREASAAKLPSVGLRLNASKSESMLASNVAFRFRGSLMNIRSWPCYIAPHTSPLKESCGKLQFQILEMTNLLQTT